MLKNFRSKLAIETKRLDEINNFLMDPGNEIINDLLTVVDNYGGSEEINRKARENGRVDWLIKQLEEKNSPYLKDLEWLINQRDKGSFISIDEYCVFKG